jgi:hypothetical protein
MYQVLMVNTIHMGCWRCCCCCCCVAAAAADILQGQGMVLDTAAGSTPQNPVYKAVTCNSNNVGVADTVYGLEEQPCTDCPDNMITAQLFKSAATGGRLWLGMWFTVKHSSLTSDYM